MTERALLETHLYFKELKKGKVRDVWELLALPGSPLLMVATDRVSAFDVVMEQGIPGKGIVLTRLSKFWFRLFKRKRITKTHFISDKLPESVMGVVDYFGEPFRIRQEIKETERKDLAQRIMIVKKTKVIPVEFIVRGYLAGSEWERYKRGEGIREIWPETLTRDLKEGSRLTFPILSYTTKAEEGHDQNLSFQEMKDHVENWLKDNGLFSHYMAYLCTDHLIGECFAIYQTAAQFALSKGIIIADTKFEFGIDEKRKVLLVDEVLTPDSSRFWLKERWQPGKRQEGYDKQPLRDWLEKTGWNKDSPPPNLSEEIIQQVSERYKEILKLLIS